MSVRARLHRSILVTWRTRHIAFSFIGASERFRHDHFDGQCVRQHPGRRRPAGQPARGQRPALAPRLRSHHRRQWRGSAGDRVRTGARPDAARHDHARHGPLRPAGAEQTSARTDASTRCLPPRTAHHHTTHARCSRGPGMDGFALLERIKQLPELLRLPVVFLTAAHDRELLLRAFDAGAVDYVTKPFMPEELLARVNAHVGLKQTRDRLERVARERQELVNLVAHDLKNPLTSVLFASDILIHEGTRPERIPRYLEMIHESAHDALGYIKRYLEAQADSVLSRQQAGSGDVAAPLPEVLAWLSRRYGLQLEGRGVQLLVQAPPRCKPVAIDDLVQIGRAHV